MKTRVSRRAFARALGAGTTAALIGCSATPDERAARLREEAAHLRERAETWTWWGDLLLIAVIVCAALAIVAVGLGASRRRQAEADEATLRVQRRTYEGESERAESLAAAAADERIEAERFAPFHESLAARFAGRETPPSSRDAR